MLSTLICIFILTFSKFAKAATTASENLENVGDNIRVGEIVETAPEPEPMISGRDLTAILGGVICFWGGVWALGAIFMIVLMAKNYCIKSAAAGGDID